MAGMSNKAKAMGNSGITVVGIEDKSPKGKEPEETRIMVVVEDTNVDGKKQKTYKIKPCCMEGEESIFTDKQKFMDEIGKLIGAAPKSEDSESEDTEEVVEESDTSED